MQSAREIIKSWPNVPAFAADIGVKEKTARMMVQRNSIDVAHWRTLVDAANKRGLEGVTYEVLVEAHQKSRAAA